MTQSRSVDATRALAKIKRAETAFGKKANRRAQMDAARQSRTQAQRGIKKSLNLPVKEIRQRLKVSRTADRKAVDLAASYVAVPAHKFLGWRYRAVYGGRGVAETARVSRLLKSAQLRKGKGGLFVRFYRNKPRIHFPKAFRTAKIGGGKVFVQRQGKARKPLEPITGPSPHQAFADGLDIYAEHGREAYKRRLRYWIDEYARREQLQ